MGREVRMVPPDWQHPRDGSGKYIPIYTHFPYDAEEIAEGLRDGWLDDEPPNYGCDVMPEFPAGTATHYMMYEDCTEGTPISPAFATPEELAHWLADTGASAFADMGAPYESWLAIARGGWAPSLVMSPGVGCISGVEAMTALHNDGGT